MPVCKRTKHSKLTAAFTGAILAGSVFALTSNVALAASPYTTVVHQASGYGAEVKVGTVVKLGPVAVAQFPSCYTQNVGSLSATAASADYGSLLTAGAVTSTADSTATTSTATTEIVGVNILGGLITTDDLKAVSTSSVVAGTYTFSNSAAGSSFGNLKVLGLPIAINVAPNTVIELPLVGSVTINEQTPVVSSDMSSLVVNMIHVRITLGVNKGSQIIIGSATSSIKKQSVPAVVGGYAYAPDLTVAGVTSGPLVEETIPCFGTGGAVETDSIASVSFPGLVSTGTVTVTGEGNINKTETDSQATTSIAGINLLGGLVSATAITGTATGTTTDGTNFEFTGGSTFVGLSVAGHPEITVDVAPNTRINIAGLGYIYFNRIYNYPDKITVIPIELHVSTANTLGIPVGADLKLGAAEAQLHSAVVP